MTTGFANQLAALQRIASFSAALRGHELGQWQVGKNVALCPSRGACSGTLCADWIGTSRQGPQNRSQFSDGTLNPSVEDRISRLPAHHAVFQACPRAKAQDFEFRCAACRWHHSLQTDYGRAKATNAISKVASGWYNIHLVPSQDVPQTRSASLDYYHDYMGNVCLSRARTGREEVPELAL